MADRGDLKRKRSPFRRRQFSYPQPIQPEEIHQIPEGDLAYVTYGTQLAEHDAGAQCTQLPSRSGIKREKVLFRYRTENLVAAEIVSNTMITDSYRDGHHLDGALSDVKKLCEKTKDFLTLDLQPVLDTQREFIRVSENRSVVHDETLSKHSDMLEGFKDLASRPYPVAEPATTNTANMGNQNHRFVSGQHNLSSEVIVDASENIQVLERFKTLKCHPRPMLETAIAHTASMSDHDNGFVSGQRNPFSEITSDSENFQMPQLSNITDMDSSATQLQGSASDERNKDNEEDFPAQGAGPKKGTRKFPNPLPMFARNQQNDGWDDIDNLSPKAASFLEKSNRILAKGKTREGYATMVRTKDTSGFCCVQCPIVARNRRLCGLQATNTACQVCIRAGRPCAKLIPYNGEEGIAVAWLPLPAGTRGNFRDGKGILVFAKIVHTRF